MKVELGIIQVFDQFVEFVQDLGLQKCLNFKYPPAPDESYDLILFVLQNCF